VIDVLDAQTVVVEPLVAAAAPHSDAPATTPSTAPSSTPASSPPPSGDASQEA
jgi:hypothetical protein